jgi:hypothetical protein
MKRALLLTLNLTLSTICSVASSGVAFADTAVPVPHVHQERGPAVARAHWRDPDTLLQLR